MFFTTSLNSYMSNLEKIEELYKIYNINENNKTIDFNIEGIENKEMLNKLKNIIKIYLNKNE